MPAIERHCSDGSRTLETPSGPAVTALGEDRVPRFGPESVHAARRNKYRRSY